MISGDYIYFYSACLIFVFSNIFCAIVRATHVCKPYRDNRNFYFPAYRNTILSYIALAFEFPYFLHIHSTDALFYAQMFNLLIYPPILVAEIKSYFFYKGTKQISKFFLVFLPSILLLPLFLISLDGQDVLMPYHGIITLVAIALFIPQLYILYKTMVELRIWMKNKMESQFSNLEDFPNELGSSAFWMIPIIFALTITTSIVYPVPWMKLIWDVFITVVNFTFLCYILDPHRKITVDEDNVEDEKPIEKQSKEQLRRLQKELVELIVNQQMFKNKNLKMDDLAKQLSTNRNYLSEAFAMTQYGSFYKMVNQCRIDYSIKLMMKHPEYRIDQIAIESGFTSRITYTMVFKNIMNITPTEWLERSSDAIEAKKELI